ncbi:DNAJ domain-containing protein Erj5 [Schizosaccharomyces cryophilus OY26]|uniref:DNAJ domain-containing protein Erj5 n=1 Tax=Schizosaccharomyces cryophilus (strain OY26 / ATCC MYA-4695 / CBS 11777 / NBRC 106824 / NRRL Y48691) TaxID=653667 RepID=S9VWL6_SCHCR|nr:DNAJ domain-containing protein Erj5 [Schizosaccharomyces cryophilus OY26]EPY52048.1 DNAJ domain-containing protein Erj5 [Schizosaccharomyces cryophilus OY26]
MINRYFLLFLFVGEKITFYELLGVSSKASIKEINRAYRKKSILYHPDKNPSTKELYTLLGLIVNILRNSDTRKRYDHFLKSGFPRWKGTAYLYSRYRPGLGTVLILLAVFITFAHLMMRLLSVKRQKKIMQDHIDVARQYEQHSNAAKGTKRLVTVPEGKRIYTVDSFTGQVCILDPSSNVEYLVSPSAVPDVRFSDTLLYRIPKFFLQTFILRWFTKNDDVQDAGVNFSNEEEEKSESKERLPEQQTKPAEGTAKAGKRRVKRRSNRVPLRKNDQNT